MYSKPKSTGIKKTVTIKRQPTEAMLKPEMTNILNQVCTCTQLFVWANEFTIVQANISKKELEGLHEEKEINKDDPRWEILQAATKDLVNILQLEVSLFLSSCLQIYAVNHFPSFVFVFKSDFVG